MRRGRWSGLSMLLTIGVVLLLYGCQPHGVNLRPAPQTPGQAAYSIPSPAPPQRAMPWWEPFGDPKLDAMIQKALAQNFDVVQALARLRQAEALSRQSRAARLPALNLEVTTEQEWLDNDQQDQLTRAGGALTWELDIFNRLQATEMARRSEQAALEEEVETVQLSISAEVVSAYFDAVEQRSQLVLLERQIDVDRELLALTELRFNAGVTSSVDVLQQSGQLAETESLIPPAQAGLRIAENRLDLLIGQAPDAIDRVTDADRLIDVEALPFVGVPSDLLLNRPDLRAQQNTLIAADSQIGQAIADRLPRIVLNGSLGYEDGPEFSGRAASLLGSLVQPLLDWGARKAEVERSKALYTERLAAFSQAYLEAIEAVENALYQERRQREFLKRLERRRHLLSRTVDETRDRYSNGLTDFLPVLDAIKELQDVERIILRQQRVLLGIRIQLHRALGGSLGPSGTGGL